MHEIPMKNIVICLVFSLYMGLQISYKLVDHVKNPLKNIYCLYERNKY